MCMSIANCVQCKYSEAEQMISIEDEDGDVGLYCTLCKHEYHPQSVHKSEYRYIGYIDCREPEITNTPDWCPRLNKEDV